MKEFALYKGEEILCIGTIKEIAGHQGIKEESVKFYGTDSYKRRLKKRRRSKNAKLLVSIED